jgi:FAD/FMN-containing dehydrogenase
VDLAVGSEGTLGVITAVTFHTHAEPAQVAVALLGVPEVGALGEMASASHSIPGVQACEYFGARLLAMGGAGDDPRLDGMYTDGGLLLLELAGTEDQVADGLARARELAARTGGLIIATEPEAMDQLWAFRHAASPSLARALARGRRSTQFIEDSVVPVSRLHDYVTGLEEILARHETDAAIFGHAGDGNLHVNPLVELGRSDWRSRVRRILDDTVALVADLGGTLAGEHGDGRLRTPYLPRFFHPAVIRAFARVKSTLDPDGILNPGVIVPDRRRGAAAEVDPLAGLGEAPGFAEGTQGPERDRHR